MSKADINIVCCSAEISKCNLPSETELELWETEADRQRVLDLLRAYDLESDDILVTHLG